jgi:hypothetical protein
VEEEEEEVKRLDSIADYVAEQSELLTNHTFSLVHLIQGSPHSLLAINSEGLLSSDWVD